MAQVSVDFTVMRDKAKTIEAAAAAIERLYSEMLKEVTTTANGMQGTTIETQKERFVAMQSTFEVLKTDMTAYSQFLKDAADGYEAVETEGTRQAAEQGKVF